MQTGFQSLAEIVGGKGFGGMKWHDEERCCELHGRYLARVVFLGENKVSDGYCPICHRLREEEAARGRAAVYAQIEAERERQRLSLAKRFVSRWQKAREGGYGLFFYGNPGTGKSHLAISIIKALLPQAAGLYTRVPDMIGYIRAQWHPDSETSSYAAIRSYVDIDLLVVDELGVQSGSINEQTLLFEVIDARLSENRPTIFLSNLAPIDLVPIIGERLVDRIKGKCVAQRFSGDSRRKPLTADVFGEAA